VTFKIEIPRNLNEAQREAIKKYAEVEDKVKHIE
jgi:DnaJ-class molecular chaperone